jgi:hypothetical protein
MNMTRNPRKSYSRKSSFIIAKDGSDAKGVLVTINKNRNNIDDDNKNGDDCGGDDDDDNNNNNNNNNNNKALLSANAKMSNVNIID